VSEQEKGSPRGSQIIDGYGDDNSLDRLQSWYDNLPADSRKKVDDEFISDIWRVLDTAGNLLITDLECVCGTKWLASITSLIAKSLPATSPSATLS